MKRLGFDYEVRARLSLTLAETTFLKTVAEHHYDWKCREIGRCGALNGLYNHALYPAEDPADDHGCACSSHDIDTMMKIMEQAHWHCRTDDDRKLAAGILLGLRAAFEAINAEWGRVSGHDVKRLTPSATAREDA